jgi:hypothetical protein
MCVLVFTVSILFCMCMGVFVMCVRCSNVCTCIYCMYFVLYVYGCFCNMWMFL